MKVIVTEKERAFVYKNHIFERMLEPGAHHISSFGNYTVEKITISDKAFHDEVKLSLFLKDPAFERSINLIEVADHELALHHVDGRFAGALTSGKHAFWNIFNQHTFTLASMNDDKTLQELPRYIIEQLPDVFRCRILVEEGMTALLHIDGSFESALSSGVYYFWHNGRKITAPLYDLRQQQLEISGQEMLTADKVALRINFVCAYRITDVIRLHRELSDYTQQIYTAAQLILRKLTGQLTFDELLSRKDDLSAEVLAALQEKESEFCVCFVSAGLKDVILPGEIRDIMNSVLIAEKRRKRMLSLGGKKLPLRAAC